MNWDSTWQNLKTNKMSVRPAKTHISLGIRQVWSVFKGVHWVARDPRFLHADSEDWSDWVDAQADLRLRWAHTHFVGFCHVMAQFLVIFFQRRDTTYKVTQKYRRCQEPRNCLVSLQGQILRSSYSWIFYNIYIVSFASLFLSRTRTKPGYAICHIHAVWSVPLLFTA